MPFLPWLFAGPAGCLFVFVPPDANLEDPLKRTFFTLLKFGVSAALIAWLVVQAQRDKAFADLATQPKDWLLLAAASACCFVAVALTFVRWYVLVRALDLPFSLKDSFRLGFLGYLLNFVSLGAVGGDLFKAVFVAREQPGRRAEAVATVVLDRLVGLYMLFVLGTLAILATDQMSSSSREVLVVAQGTLLCTALGAAGIGVLLIPGLTQGAFSAFLQRLPRIGPLFGKLLGAIRIYRQRPGMLLLSAVMSLFVHSLTAAGIWLVSRGLPGESPSLADHLVIVPLAMVTGVLPLPVNGLGAFETAIVFLYESVPAGLDVSEGRGLVVAFGYRAITILIALVGVCYYLASRREVAQLMHEAEVELEHEQAAESSAAQPEPGGNNVAASLPPGAAHAS